ncbi:MAG TPA: DNA-formamidopyrimidine glycosylase family protein [Candidatus Sulfotelmatobacter sp.]|nr:DNA-formamidopyrimidine glycosylase family protein [Candidatus Sulfotelmatobacter sp.]
MEGPPLKAIAESLSSVAGNKIISAYGNAKIDITNLEGKTINRIFSIGKNLLFQLPEDTVRVHFGMFGSYTIDNPRENIKPSLSLKTQNTIIEFYRCSIKLIPNQELNTIFDEEVDITSERWNVQKVLKLILNQQDELICDVLLDQTVFAGVGNIIKNEVLFLARVHPLSRTGNVPKEKIEEIINQARSFSITFYESRKKGQRLNTYLKIYQRSKCRGSGEKVLRIITGEKKAIKLCMPRSTIPILILHYFWNKALSRYFKKEYTESSSIS